MKIRAKFACNNVTKDSLGNEHVAMHAVYGNGEANKEWSKYTPAGSLSMVISQEGAQGKLLIGKEYYLDFTPIEDAVEAPVEVPTETTEA